MKMRIAGYILTALFVLGTVHALDLSVTEIPLQDTVILDLEQPAQFQLKITNNGPKETITLDTVIGITITPSGPFTLESGETRTIPISLLPQDFTIAEPGPFPFEYRIKNAANEIQKETLTINLVTLATIFETIIEPITPNAEQAVLVVKNMASLAFDSVTMHINAAFIDAETTFSIGPRETKVISIPLQPEKLRTLSAGQYLTTITTEIEGKTAKKEQVITFREQEDITTESTDEPGIIHRREITKRNVGNIRKQVDVAVETNIFGSLFTTTNVPPTQTEITGLTKTYIWERNLVPGEELTVIVRTNWLYPFIFIILVGIVIWIIYKTMQTDVIAEKKVSYVKTHGGEFALKVTLTVRARRLIEDINIIDKLPPLVKLYERYGTIHPDRVDHQNRRIEWNFPALEENEQRTVSYIIYSKIGIVGRFELPPANITYEKNGEVTKTTTNRAFFVNEPRG